MATVPNQNTITIHREMPKKNFLQLKNENWQNAIKDLQDPYAFVLYIYLASNADGYTLDLSPAHIKEVTGMPRSTYYKKLKLLKDKGYITTHGKTMLHFHETSKSEEEQSSLSCEQEITKSNLCGGINFLQYGLTSSSEKRESSSDNIEIDNTTDVIYNNKYSSRFNEFYPIPSGEFDF